jgi:hypothetical protein
MTTMMPRLTLKENDKAKGGRSRTSGADRRDCNEVPVSETAPGHELLSFSFPLSFDSGE